MSTRLKMNLKVPALTLFLAVKLSNVAYPMQGLRLKGAALALLVFHKNSFGAEGAWQAVKKKFGKLRTQQDNSDREPIAGPAAAAEDRRQLPKEINKMLKHQLSDYHVFGCVYCRTDSFESLTKPTKNGGEKYVQKFLRWMPSAEQAKSSLDLILPVGGKESFYSYSEAMEEDIVRLPRFDGSAELWNIRHAEAGELLLYPVVVPEESMTDILFLKKVLQFPEDSLSLTDFFGLNSPIKTVLQYRLYVVLDILCLKDDLLRKMPAVPGETVLNLFFLHTHTVSNLSKLLDVLAKRSVTEGNAVRRAQLSLSLQVLQILTKLREKKIILPHMTSDSFVVSSTGLLYLAHFSPYYVEGKEYIRVDDGSIVERKPTKKFYFQLKGRHREPLTSKKGEAEEYKPDSSQNDRDVVLILRDIWCLKPGEEVQSGEGEPLRDTMSGSDTHSDSSGELQEAAAASLLPEDWKDCNDTPHTILEIVELLKQTDGPGLGNLSYVESFRQLEASLTKKTGNK